jgi:hypothetical protein
LIDLADQLHGEQANLLRQGAAAVCKGVGHQERDHEARYVRRDLQGHERPAVHAAAEKEDGANPQGIAFWWLDAWHV